MDIQQVEADLKYLQEHLSHLGDPDERNNIDQRIGRLKEALKENETAKEQIEACTTLWADLKQQIRSNSSVNTDQLASKISGLAGMLIPKESLSAGASQMTQLPPELFSPIFNHLSLKDLGKMRSTSEKMRAKVNSYLNPIWTSTNALNTILALYCAQASKNPPTDGFSKLGLILQLGSKNMSIEPVSKIGNLNAANARQYILKDNGCQWVFENLDTILFKLMIERRGNESLVGYVNRALKEINISLDQLKVATRLSMRGLCQNQTELAEFLEAHSDKLTELRKLDLSDSGNLTTLPPQIGKLTALTSLRLTQCSNLATLPPQIGKLTALTSLDLHYCRALTTLPPEIENLTALTSLDLMDCASLQELPPQIGALTALTSLDLSYCASLQALPPQIGALTALTSLDLHYCRALTTLPPEIENLTALTSLNLKDCASLQALPPQIGALTALTSLDLSDCVALTELPPQIGALTALTSLNLSDCDKLRALPPEIQNLTKCKIQQSPT